MTVHFKGAAFFVAVAFPIHSDNYFIPESLAGLVYGWNILPTAEQNNFFPFLYQRYSAFEIIKSKLSLLVLFVLDKLRVERYPEYDDTLILFVDFY